MFNGVNAFRIAVIELSISVSAIANRYAGINVPKKEVNAMYFHFCLGILGKLLKPITNKKIAAKIIRNDPNCIADKPTRPFFININELPQINASVIK